MTARKGFTSEEAAQVARQIGYVVRSPRELENLRMGMDVELEHGLAAGANNVTSDDPAQTAKIALAHLSEFDDYYQRLDDMEKAARASAQGSSRINIIIIIILALIVIIIIIIIFIGNTRTSALSIPARDSYI